MRALFLYTELSGYFMACINTLSKRIAEVHIVRWPVNREAPFTFSFAENVKIYERNDYSSRDLIELANSISPDFIFTSGWIDKGYLSVCRQFKNRIPTIMGMDNQWHGTAKQKLMCMLSSFTIHPYFNHIWVSGSPQKTYAQKLGFNNESIHTGVYCADVDLFSNESSYRIEAEEFPKRLIYVGRYIKAKGLDLLFDAFIELQTEENNDWELWCVGTGDLFDQAIKHPKIKHFGFVQPGELKTILRKAGVFVLPSRFEPWGVVVHEMAAAGFPMILSDAVGSHTQFLKSETNGFLFANEEKTDLKSALKKMMTLSDKSLIEMATASHEIGISYTPNMWVEKLLKHIIKK
ncbi:glycosyltransferase family 4 protein [Natronoflexus pectinivorans]|uniref:Glycosyltransferase involved in cell wall biosynthesis n=1 Tax=Natronoflexus pectinivorans TaxID=682526 RepID=A0A4R2GFG3_9BACT|nr:glycosyltransferase family 4 protein [Natronoflexus pectinivorans]TCO06886.1 glycosyltransferase involved in cell wall biosynthesis [Natronoflexus pectinivorans]